MALSIHCDSCELMAGQNLPWSLRIKTLEELMHLREESARNYPPSIQRLEMVLDNLVLLLGNGNYPGRERLWVESIVNKLMWRNYPELMKLKGSEKCVVFVPDHYLINSPECVAPDRVDGEAFSKRVL